MLLDMSKKSRQRAEILKLLGEYPARRNPMKIELPDPLHEGEEGEEEEVDVDDLDAPSIEEEELHGEEYLRTLEEEKIRKALARTPHAEAATEKRKQVRAKKERKASSAPSVAEIKRETRGPRGPYKESGEMICTSPQLFVKLMEFVHDDKPTDIKLHRMAEGMTRRGRKGWDMHQYEDIIRMNPALRGKYYHLPIIDAKYFEPRYATLGHEKFHHVLPSDLAHAREVVKKRTGLSRIPKGAKLVVAALKDRAPLFRHTMGPKGPHRWAIQKVLIPAGGRRKNPLDLMLVGGNPDGRKLVSGKYRTFHSTDPRNVEHFKIDGLKKPEMRLVRIGHCMDFEVTKNGTPNLVQFPGGKPHIYFKDDGKMLIISKQKISSGNIQKVVSNQVSKGPGKIHAVSYKAPEHSSKHGTPYRHQFGTPKPSWYSTKDGSVIIIRGGRFYVKDWIYK